MREKLLEYFKPREEKVVMAGETYFVRTKPDDFEVSGGDDAMWDFIVGCTFDADGERVFTHDDIPALKAAKAVLTARLRRAVAVVNGFDTATEEKNSEAGPSSG